MIREGRYDRVLGKMLNRIERVSGKLAKEFKGTKPFDKEPVSMREQIYNYETQGYDTFKVIANTQGIEAAVMWQQVMEVEKEKYTRRQ